MKLPLKHSFNSSIIIFSLILSTFSNLHANDNKLTLSSRPASAKIKTPIKQQKPSKTEISTPRSYKRDDFCDSDNGAASMMAKLDKENEDKLNEAKDLKKQIEEITAQNNIINQVQALKNDYEKSILAYTEEISLEKKPELKKALTDFKKMLRSGLTINALSLLTKQEDLTKPDAFKMSTICQKIENEPICNKYDPKMPGTSLFNPKFSILGLNFGNEVHDLDIVLENFKKMYDRTGQAADKETIKTNINSILSSIPPKIQPSMLLKIIEDKAPDLGTLLSKNINKDDLFKCLQADNTSEEESLQSCQLLMNDQNKRETLKNIVSTQSKNLQASMNEKLSDTLNLIHAHQDERLLTTFANIDKSNKLSEDHFSSFATQAMQKIKSIAHLASEPLKKMKSKESHSNNHLDNLETLFYISPNLTDQSSSIVVNISKAEEKAKKDAEEFQKICNFNEVLVIPKTERVSKCRMILEQLKPKIDFMMSSHGNKLKELENKLKTLADADFNNIENLKKFVAEKYICSCTTYDKKIEIKDQSLNLDVSTCTNQTYKAHLSLQTIENLVPNVEAILGKKLYAKEINADKNKCEQTFSKANIAEFQKTCDISSIAEKYSNICEKVSEENSYAKTKLEPTDYDKVYKDYYVDYKDGKYIKTRKKSNMTLFAEGALPTLAGNLIPMFLGSMQLTQNIEMLTNQAIYQKQMFHTIDIYNQNPWMYQYSYFTGTFGSTQPLPTYGTNGSTGFNFN